MLLNVVTSEHCPAQDRSLRILKYDRTLPELYTLMEYIDIKESYAEADIKDNPPK